MVVKQRLCDVTYASEVHALLLHTMTWFPPVTKHGACIGHDNMHIWKTWFAFRMTMQQWLI